MSRVTIESFKHFHSLIWKRYATGRPMIYRGVKNSSYKLVPKVGRKNNYSLKLEKELLELFQIRCVSFLQYQPENKWEWLANA